MATYTVTATFEVTGTPGCSRAVTKMMHGFVQSLVDEGVAEGAIEFAITGASADSVTELKP